MAKAIAMHEKTTLIPEKDPPQGIEKPHKKPCLIQVTDFNLGRRFVLEQRPMVIGRASEADICILEPSVSRKHAVIHWNDDDQVTLNDCHSSNGSYVNNVKIMVRYTLVDRDIIHLGKAMLKFYSLDSIDSFLHDRIYQRSVFDRDTQIFNKAYLLEALANIAQSAESQDSKHFALLMIDLDAFKRVNEDYGQSVGDHVLLGASALLQRFVRPEETFGRFGGDEFMLIIPGCDEAGALERAERIRAAFEADPFRVPETETGLTELIEVHQSISVAVCTGEVSASVEALLEKAAQKLYLAEREGGNRVMV